MKITNDIKYVGVNDHAVDLFEGQYVVPEGMAYNSYIILDEKVAVIDSVEKNFTHEWLDNIARELGGRQPDYLVVQHMEPDHSANISAFMKNYLSATVVSSAKAKKGITPRIIIQESNSAKTLFMMRSSKTKKCAAEATH